MSTRRFVAYFLAVSAGSTVAFTSTLSGQPAPQAVVRSENGTVLTDTGLDTLPPETVRMSHSTRHHRFDKPAAGTTWIARARIGA